MDQNQTDLDQIDLCFQEVQVVLSVEPGVDQMLAGSHFIYFKFIK